MKTEIAAKPIMSDVKPFSIFSAPRLGPIVRSSMISIGAAKEPARNKSAKSFALSVVGCPVIWNLEPNSPWIVAMVRTSPLPFSNKIIPIGLPIFSRVISCITRPPAASNEIFTAGRWFWSKPALASVMRSPLKMTDFLNTPWRFSPKRNTSIPGGGVSPTAIVETIGSASLDSRVAVRPIMSFARAVSWTPGNCTTIRSAPCCWITGSLTASSFTRLLRVTIFCLTALSWISFKAVGLNSPTSFGERPVGLTCQINSGWLVINTERAFSASSVLPKVSVMLSGPRSIPCWRIDLSRNWLRISVAKEVTFFWTAPFMSTCSKK